MSPVAAQDHKGLILLWVIENARECPLLQLIICKCLYMSCVVHWYRFQENMTTLWPSFGLFPLTEREKVKKDIEFQSEIDGASRI
jgi:hypothetical protein